MDDVEREAWLTEADPLVDPDVHLDGLDALAAAVVRRRRRRLWSRSASVGVIVVAVGGVGFAAAAATGVFGSDAHGRDIEYGKDFGERLDVNNAAFPADVRRLTPTSLPLPKDETWPAITEYLIGDYHRIAVSFAPDGYEESVGDIVRSYERIGWCAWGRSWLQAPTGSAAAGKAVAGLHNAAGWPAIGIFHDAVYVSANIVAKAAAAGDTETVHREWASLCAGALP